MKTAWQSRNRLAIAGSRTMLSLVILVIATSISRAHDPEAPTTMSYGTFKPVPLPDPGIPGYHFPESEATVLTWVANTFAPPKPQDQIDSLKNIHLHGWGLWTALTTHSGEKYEGQNLRVFETWLTPNNIQEIASGKNLVGITRLPRHLEPFRQLQIRPRRAKGPAPAEATVVGFVKYDPTAAHHIISQKLLQKSTLDSLLANGKDAVPAFPVTGVSLKPVYQPLGSGKLILSGGAPVMQQGRYFPIPVWPGPPATPMAYDTDKWPSWVWVNIKGGGAGNGKVVTITPPGPPAPSTIAPDVTYGVDKFIHFQLTSQVNVDGINTKNKAQNQDQPTVAIGDFAVLLGMHVTTREITQWTWQTFWWLPNADKPAQPSSAAIAADRPNQLKDAPRNYAMSQAYSSLLPQQPLTGGQNAGDSIYAYNPYLEAGFGPSDLPASIPGTLGTEIVANNVGVQSNCMSCHGMACYGRGGQSSALEGSLYTGDRYVDQQGPQFRGNLKTDFLWSIGRAK